MTKHWNANVFVVLLNFGIEKALDGTRRGSWDALGRSCAVLARCWGGLLPPGRALGTSRKGLGEVLELLGRSWAILGSS